jgi:hypothetical protein
VTLPSRPLKDPRTTVTSSWHRLVSIVAGYGIVEAYVFSHRNGEDNYLRTLCFSRSSLLSGACRCQKRPSRSNWCQRTDITMRRTLLGAPKWAFRDLRRELATDCWTLVIVLVLTTVMLVRIASAKARSCVRFQN